MGTTALRQLLISLCDNSPWNYAVLWKLRHGSQMVLTWEDGYFNYPKPRELVESTTDDAFCIGTSDILSPQFETNTSRDSSDEYPVGLLLADMSYLQYALGKGVVGQVAFTSNHCWVSLNNIFSGKTHKQCPEEWLLQFASGIKTILLVPVLPHGVVQLGSLEEVAEDINTIVYVKDRFNGPHGVIENTAPFSLNKEFQAQLSSPLVSGVIEYTNTPHAFTSVETEDLSIAVNSVDTDNLSTASQVLPLLSVQDTYMPAGEDLPEAFKNETENEIDVPPISLAEISTPGVSIDASQLEMVESKLLELSCLMEELQAYSDSNNYEDLLGESLNGIMKSYPSGDMAGEPSGGKTYFDMDNEVVSSFLRFPKDCELHKALGPSFRKQTNEKLWNSSFLVEDTCRTSSVTFSLRTEPSLFARGGDAGDLLEAVVANAYSGSDDTSNRSGIFNSSTSFSGHVAAPRKLQKPSKALALVRDDSIPSNHFTSACITEDKTADSTSSSLRRMINTIFSKEQQERGCEDKQVRKGHKMLNFNKRRAKPGDDQRPRPRDRQLIQDRVKELRELVPNGAKCSIDGLLDRTIQHMLYLRSVTDQAEKLRQCVHQELAGCKNWKSTETKDNCQNGTSWAYEFGNEFQMCPIIVEDLAFPGHMLIEMLCNEHALFLEIAQVIRGLELTILKGVLENRSSNTWARFIIEASTGFHRLDIFWPLMQLLQRKKKSYLKQDLKHYLPSQRN